MATDLIEIDPEQPVEEAIERAAAQIRRGDVIAIPTEALYTLVADICSVLLPALTISGGSAALRSRNEGRASRSKTKN